MKHDLSYEILWSKHQKELLPQIVEKVHSEFNTNDQQLKAMISPIIGNAEFKRVNQELENERFSTLIKLARVLDDESMTKAINALDYSLNINKK